MLKLLVTSDWRLDRSFARFGRDTKRLTEARVAALERVFAEAEAQGVSAVVCAGDLFDSPQPSSATREALLSALRKLNWTSRTLLLVPGDRDALVEGSVWLDEAFRGQLPACVRIATKAPWGDGVGWQNEVTTLELDASVVLYALAGTSRVRGAAAFPSRAEGDRRVRIGVTHVVHAAPDGEGLDLLALGGEGHFNFVDAGKRVVFPGTHEPYDFSPDQGRVALISVNAQTRQVLVEPRAVNVLTWETVKLTSLAALRQFAQRTDLGTRVVKVEVEAALSLADFEVFERELSELEERPELFLEVDARGLKLDPAKASASFAAWPQVLQKTAAELLAQGSLTALTHLARTLGKGEG